MVKQGRHYPEIVSVLRERHPVEMSRAQFDGLMTSLYRRYGAKSLTANGSFSRDR
jgi:hypothetical protein